MEGEMEGDGGAGLAQKLEDLRAVDAAVLGLELEQRDDGLLGHRRAQQLSHTIRRVEVAARDEDEAHARDVDVLGALALLEVVIFRASCCGFGQHVAS